MNNIQRTALQQAIRLLTAAGVEYAVRADGQVYGTLPIAVAPVVDPHKRMRRPNENDWVGELNYHPQLAALPENQSVKFTIQRKAGQSPEDAARRVNSARGAISSTAIRMFGPGNIMTTATVNSEGVGEVEVLRLGDGINQAQGGV